MRSVSSIKKDIEAAKDGLKKLEAELEAAQDRCPHKRRQRMGSFPFDDVVCLDCGKGVGI